VRGWARKREECVSMSLRQEGGMVSVGEWNSERECEGEKTKKNVSVSQLHPIHSPLERAKMLSFTLPPSPPNPHTYLRISATSVGGQNLSRTAQPTLLRDDAMDSALFLRASFADFLCAHTQSHAHAHAHAHTHAHAHAHVNAHAHAHAHAHMHIRMHTHVHARRDACTYANIRTYRNKRLNFHSLSLFRTQQQIKHVARSKRRLMESHV